MLSQEAHKAVWTKNKTKVVNHNFIHIRPNRNIFNYEWQRYNHFVTYLNYKDL